MIRHSIIFSFKYRDSREFFVGNHLNNSKCFLQKLTQKYDDAIDMDK